MLNVPILLAGADGVLVERVASMSPMHVVQGVVVDDASSPLRCTLFAAGQRFEVRASRQALLSGAVDLLKRAGQQANLLAGLPGGPS